MVERANYEVIRFLTACVADVDVRANWPTYIPFVQRVINTMIKTSTGVSPTELLYGNTIDHDSTLVAKIDEEFQEISSVLNHRFKSNKKRTRDIQLQMTWDNDPNPQWCDWNSTFGAVEKVQKYLNDNQMRKYIPIKYTWDKNHPNYEPPIKRSRSS